MKELFNKTSVKFLAGFAALLLLGLLGLYMIKEYKGGIENVPEDSVRAG